MLTNTKTTRATMVSVRARSENALMLMSTISSSVCTVISVTYRDTDNFMAGTCKGMCKSTFAARFVAGRRAQSHLPGGDRHLFDPSFAEILIGKNGRPLYTFRQFFEAPHQQDQFGEGKTDDSTSFYISRALKRHPCAENILKSVGTVCEKSSALKPYDFHWIIFPSCPFATNLTQLTFYQIIYDFPMHNLYLLFTTH